MEQFRGNILDGDRVLAANVEGVMERTWPRGGRLYEWHGQLELPSGAAPPEFISVGGPYRLKLEDGREGDILVSRIGMSSHGSTSVEFQGTGPLE